MYRRWGKRCFDVVLAGLGLIVLAPLLLLLVLVVRLELGSPILFRQKRAGRGGSPFQIIKLRTMTTARDVAGDLLPDEDRLTRLGRFLRATSLDELPELWNVLRGQMSLVGPRPLLMRYVAYYSVRERRRLEALPGITGWAQIHGRNELPWDERLERDVWYVEHLSFILDIKILVATVIRVLRREGVYLAPATRMMDLDVERNKEGQ